MKPLNGNSNDNKEFREIIRAFAKNLQDVEGVETFVADSALYSKETVELMHENNVKFVTRVPVSVARVGELIELGTSGKKELCNLGDGYEYFEDKMDLAGINLRVIAIRSQKGATRSEKTLKRKLLRESLSQVKSYKKLRKQEFACEEDSPLANIPLRLAYSKDKAVNAFAIPGNCIVVTQGLYDAANSENEIAMVLSHELGHFHHRDHMKAYAQGMIYLLFSVALFQNDDFLNYVRGVLSGITNTYSRGKESQADRFALELMQRAYLGNSAGILDFFRKRSEVEGVLLKKLAFFSTHPSSEKRLRQLSKMIQELNMSDQGVTRLGILHKTEKPVVALPDG